MRTLFLLLALLLAGVARADTAPGVAATPGVGVPNGLPVSAIVTGGVAVTLMPAGWMVPNYAVCDIQNDPNAPSGELLYVDLKATALAGRSTSFALIPGQVYRISRPISTAVSAVAATTGHLIIGSCY